MEQTETKNKLSDLLSTMSDDELIFVGSKTLWFFIGTVEECRNCSNAIDAQLMDFWKKKIDSDKKFIKNLCSSYIRDVVKCSHTHKDPATDSYNLRSRYIGYYENLKQHRSFKPIFEREVTLIYPRIKEGTAIVLEGNECGEYYDLEEWNNGNGIEKLKKYMKGKKENE